MQRSGLVSMSFIVWLCLGCTLGINPAAAQASAPAVQQPGILLPYWAFALLLGLTLASLVVVLFLRFHYRKRSRHEAPYSPPRLNSADFHPDRRPALERELAEIRTHHERLLKVYNQLLARHKTLIRDVQRLQKNRRAQRLEQTPSNISS